MQEIMQAISTVGFPIVAFLLMFYQGNRTIKDNTNALRQLCEYIRK